MATLRVKINGIEVPIQDPIIYVDVLHTEGNAGTAYHFETGDEARVIVYDDGEEVGDTDIDLTNQWEVLAK